MDIFIIFKYMINVGYVHDKPDLDGYIQGDIE